MKLYQTYLSPFPTRVRLALYVKGIDMELVEPPGIHDARSKGGYLDVNPLGRVPALELDDGRVLPESEVICEYLEEVFPDPPLLPKEPWARARVRLLSRLCDFYLVMAMLPLFTASAQRRKDWDPRRIDASLAEVKKSLGYIEHYIGTDGYAVGHGLTFADGALVPQLLLAFDWAPRLFDRPSPIGELPKLASYWQAVGNNPIAARLIRETAEAIAVAQKRAREGTA